MVITYTYGYNITSSDLGHLFYEELGNQSPIGNNEWGLVNTDVFQNLLNAGYWSSTVVDDQVGDEHYRFDFSLGHQAAWSNGFWANSIAVRSGRINPTTNPVNPVPEPGAALLFWVGLVGLVGVHLYRKQAGRYGVIFLSSSWIKKLGCITRLGKSHKITFVPQIMTETLSQWKPFWGKKHHFRATSWFTIMRIWR